MDGMNLYEYIGSSPINFLDPLGLSWTTQDFVDHYYGRGVIGGEWLWPGDPVDLEDVGLLGTFRSAPSVGAAVSSFKSMATTIAAFLILGVDCPDNVCAGITKSISWSSKTTTDVTAVIFAVGRSTFFRDGTCTVAVDCFCGERRDEHYLCTLSFYIRDWFRDPVHTGHELPGGTPYPIFASWTETITSL